MNNTEEIVTYKCKNCGSDLTFDATSGKLLCSSCKSTFLVSDFEEVTKQGFEKIAEKTTTTTFNENEVKEYNCDNCGAVLLTDAHTASTTCNYCGSSMVIQERLSGKVAPAQVIPFKISQKDAQAALKKWCKNGKVTPNDFLTEDRIRNLEGLYVPFWLFDINTQSEADALCTRTRMYRRGNYNISETRHYVAYRHVVADYVKIPADASEKMNDQIMDLLEPFDYKDLTKFNSAYLSGFSSEKYNYTDKELFQRVKKRTDQFAANYLRSTIRGYDSVVLTRVNSKAFQRDAVYTLFPVYVVNYKYKGKEYYFAMNGQTGKIVGKPPVCIAKVFKRALIAFLASAVICEAVYWLLKLGGIL